MSSDRFISERKGAWQRLEDLLKLLDHATLRRLHREEVRELGRIYRRTASDLAIARAESRDPRLVSYLNSLVIRAHGRIYRADAQEGRQRLKNFFLRDFPQTFRRTWKFTAVAFAVFMLFAVVGFAGSWRDAEFSELAGVSPFFRELVINTETRWWKRLNDANQVGASEIGTNNIAVTFYAFALGATFGLGTLYVLANNGASIGAVLALTYRAGFGNELLAFMSGHGVIELTCIFIAGGAGLLIGSALLLPGDLTRAEALKQRGAESIRLIIGCVPLLAVAGIIEGFISPAEISPLIKFGIAALTGLSLYSYLSLAGREET
ncbi:MAG: stage II sporulation protein M [Pyrinomonadaceae bacterium]